MNYKYNWEKHPDVINFLNRIYINTKHKLEKSKVYYIDSSEITLELTSYLEDYLHIIETYNYNFDRVLGLLNTLQYFNIVSTDTLVQNYESKIILSNSLFQTNFLVPSVENEKKKDQRLYLYKGLTSHILSFKNEDTQNFGRIYSDSLGESKVITNVLVNNGWLLLEEVLSSEIAERFSHISLQEPRLFSMTKDNYYQVSILFGMTLTGIGSIFEHSSPMIMYNLIKKSLNENFSSEVIYEYITNGNQFELYQILYIMGLLFNEDNRRFPYISLNKQEIKDFFESLYILLTSLITLGQKKYNTKENTVHSISSELNKFEKERMKKLINNRKI